MFLASTRCVSVSLTLFPPGAVYEDHRKKWLPGFALGPLHYTEWRYIIHFSSDLNVMILYTTNYKMLFLEHNVLFRQMGR